VAHLFTPPQQTYTRVLAGLGLTYSYQVSETVWKDQSGAWHSGFTPPWEELTASQLHYTRPAIVSDDVAAELTAAGIGTCVPIES
jgi:hypothetical protein